MRTNISSGDPFEDVYGHSRAVRVGNSIHVSGTTAQPPHVEGCDSYQQAKDALRIIAETLDEAGTSLASVVRTVTYVTDMADMGLVARAHLEAFADVKPAATIVQVSALDDPQRTVEIEAYAIVEESR